MRQAKGAGTLDPRFSSPDASPAPWADVEGRLVDAETYFITTVRDDGRPHSTPLVGVWLEDAFWFATGADEQKARNLETQRSALVTVGSSAFQGYDVVVEGRADNVTDEIRLEPVARAFREKYEPPFQFQVHEGGFKDPIGGGQALVFVVRPTKVLAFRKDDEFSQTRFD